MKRYQSATVAINVLLYATTATAEETKTLPDNLQEIRISVIDDDGNYVPSTLNAYAIDGKETFLAEAKPPPPTVIKTSVKCNDGMRIRAIPDIDGVYFASNPVPCQSNMTVHLVKRQTPAGTSSHAILRIVTPDGPDGDQIWITARVLVAAQASQKITVDGGGVKIQCAAFGVPSIYTTIAKYTKAGYQKEIAFHDLTKLDVAAISRKSNGPCPENSVDLITTMTSASTANYIDKNWVSVIEDKAIAKSPLVEFIRSNSDKSIQYELGDFAYKK